MRTAPSGRFSLSAFRHLGGRRGSGPPIPWSWPFGTTPPPPAASLLFLPTFRPSSPSICGGGGWISCTRTSARPVTWRRPGRGRHPSVQTKTGYATPAATDEPPAPPPIRSVGSIASRSVPVTGSATRELHRRLQGRHVDATKKPRLLRGQSLGCRQSRCH
jgi:hypothetical protein